MRFHGKNDTFIMQKEHLENLTLEEKNQVEKLSKYKFKDGKIVSDMLKEEWMKHRSRET